MIALLRPAYPANVVTLDTAASALAAPIPLIVGPAGGGGLPHQQVPMTEQLGESSLGAGLPGGGPRVACCTRQERPSPALLQTCGPTPLPGDDARRARGRGAFVTTLPPQALGALTRTWAAILQDRHPELRAICVSVVREREWLDPPAVPTSLGKSDVLALPHDVESPVERGRAA